MKKAGHLIAVYFITLCLAILVMAFLYMIIQSCRMTVVGVPLVVFSFSFFKNGCLLSLPFAGILALFFQNFSAIKSEDTSVLSFFVAMFFSLFTWLILLPLALFFIPNNLLQETEPVSIQLSSNYFRVEETMPVYYLKANDDGSYETLNIHKDAVIGSPLEHESFHIAPKAMLVDPLLSSTIGYSNFIQTPVRVLTTFYYLARSAIKAGKLAWLCFASLGLSLFALWKFVGCSRWKMVNVLFVSCTFLLLFKLQIELYTETKLQQFISNISQNIALPASLEKLIPAVIYIIIAIIFIVLGSVKRYKNLKLENEE